MRRCSPRVVGASLAVALVAAVSVSMPSSVSAKEATVVSDDMVVMTFHQWRRPDGVFRRTGDGWVQVQEFPMGRDRHGCAVGDVDGDSDPDIYCATGTMRGSGFRPNELWVNEGDGWVDRAAEWGVEDGFARGRGGVFLDFNGDEVTDLYTTAYREGRPDGLRSENVLYQGTGSGLLDVGSEANGRYGALCAVSGDFNGDWFDDLLVCDRLGLSLFRGSAWSMSGRWIQPASGVVRDALFADLNGDGFDDLLVVVEGAVEVRFGPGLRIEGGVIWDA